MTTDNTMKAYLIGIHNEKPTSPRRIRSGKKQAHRRSVFAGLPLSPGQQEVLVVDDRANLRPAQVVESKLARLLQEGSIAVSHLQMRGLLKAR
jgi:hypothetical protein